MKDKETFPIAKKEASDSGLFGRGSYKFWALAAMLLLAFWSMFTGTVSLRWSGTLNTFSHASLHDHLDVLEIEEREKLVRHMWDVYTNNRRIRLPRFWEKAFEAAYEDLTSDAADVRDVAVAEIVNMSLRSLDLQLPPLKGILGATVGVTYHVTRKRLFAMRRYGGGILYAVLPLHMQRGCFRIRTHDQQVTKAQLYRCTRRARKLSKNLKEVEKGKGATSERA
ncbi:hypothetical protein GmHk_02G003506 [Glycine max]|nr:hypothetical protein GmHk_02G003506 [Glycine max]